MKAGVPQGFATETLVILDAVDDNGPAKNVCENENVGLLQTGPRLWDRTQEKVGPQPRRLKRPLVDLFLKATSAGLLPSLGRSYLAGQGEDEGPVFLPLLLPQGEVQAEALGIPRLPLLPACVKPANTHTRALHHKSFS